MRIPAVFKSRALARRTLIHIALAISAISWISTTIHAQSNDSQIIPNRGFHPSGSYASGSIETINTTNGNLMLNIPLASLPPGRGGHPGFTLALIYNSKIWDGQPDVAPNPNNPNEDMEVTWLVDSQQGGWRYNIGGYGWSMYNRNQAGNFYPEQDCRHWNIWKMKVSFPDGSEREFRPYGYDDQCDDNFFTVMPAPGMSYYSTDGSYARLDIGQNGAWTLSLSNGTRVVSTTANQREYDRNGNYTEMSSVPNYNNTGHGATIISDQLGRSIAIEYATNEHYIHVAGVNGETITTTVKWGTTYVEKVYRAGNHFQYDLHMDDWAVAGVTEIVLPTQLGPNLKYLFGYNGWPTDGNSSPSVGWGEVSSVTMPTGARADYQYELDNESGPLLQANWVLKNAPSRKELTYSLQYDGSTTAAPPEIWVYGISDGGATITAPDGGITQESFYDIDLPGGGRVFKIQNPDGSVVERVWQENIPYLPPGVTIWAGEEINSYVGKEFLSIRDANDALVKTSIKEYRYDKNGNVTQQFEYDWVPYSSVARDALGKPTGAIPAEAQLQRVQTMAYYCVTPDASDSTTNDPDSYDRSSAPNHRSAPAASEIGSGYQTLARSEFFYDNAFTTANVTEQKVWDSTKGAYSAPLAPGNSISSSSQYDAYGNQTLAIDARGVQTKFIYGQIGSFSDLYPTTVISAFATAIQRTATLAYDFHTGVVRVAIDVDNNVTTETDYDALGRPTEIRAAANVPGAKAVKRTEYSAVDRRVITRSDLNVAYDGKLVAVQHSDQFGRIRLTRELEDSTTESPYDEASGIKVQTRYGFTTENSYVLKSNPYRAATSNGATTESTMGWTRTKSDRGGRVIEVQTFGGTGLPAPWAGNTSSSGSVTTVYDANQTTVTDQALRKRRKVVDGLGRLERVDEPDKDSGNLDDGNGVPIQSTSYAYDALGNLANVYQGTQSRGFVYSSLSRLVSATNPESGAVCYGQVVSGQCQANGYDANGNLVYKTDARGILTTYAYDPLNRLLNRTHSDSTPTVTYAYDPNIANGKGRLSSVSSSVSTYEYNSYDALGRVSGAKQTIGSKDYTLGYNYDLAGHVKTITYPSNHSVTYNYDNAGRLAAFSGDLGGAQRTYATAMSYSAHGGLTWEQYGTNTPLYHKTFYNSRAQVFDTRVSSVNDTWDWNRGRLILYYSSNHIWGSSGTDNNGNVRFSEHWIPPPNATLDQAQYLIEDSYEYDQLNRLRSVSESTLDIAGGGNWTPRFVQAYTFDRYGNRTINYNGTTPGIPRPQFDTADFQFTNRLYAPGDTALPMEQRQMQYDAAGNLTKDIHSAAAQVRLYDAENKMTKETQAGGVEAGVYSYDADGRRVRRKVNGVETWQVYGVSGELIAEYAENGQHSSPQKEYGYRNGELLITANVATGWGAPPTLEDNPLKNPDNPESYKIKAIHITQLRDAINALRAHYNRPNYPWQKPTASGGAINNTVLISWEPIDEMRTALNEAVGAPSTPYTEGLAVNQPILAVHIQELRNRVLDAWQGGGGVDLRWLVSDHLGTPRMIFDQTGSLTVTDQNGNYLSGMTRHDYLPFGEELFDGTGGRTTTLGYTASDNVRQKFTGQQRDSEINLDYFNARYYSSTHGRFISPDPFGGSGFVAVPQSWNKYTYCLNRPFVFTDPSGLVWLTTDDVYFEWVEDDEYEKNKKKYGGYRVANGAIGQYSSSVGCDECKNYKPGSWVQFNADGSVSQVADPTSYVYYEYSDQEIATPLYSVLGTVRFSELESGPKGGHRSFPNKGGGRTDRWYDSNGRAMVDIDYGHNHGAGDPHVHWWEWDAGGWPHRGEGQTVPEGWDVLMDELGGPFIDPNPAPYPRSPFGLPISPMDGPVRVPFRPGVPLRPTVPLRPILVP